MTLGDYEQKIELATSNEHCHADVELLNDITSQAEHN